MRHPFASLMLCTVPIVVAAAQWFAQTADSDAPNPGCADGGEAMP